MNKENRMNIPAPAWSRLFIRVVLATAGGYLLVSLLASALGLLLPGTDLDAAMLSMMLAFILQPVAAIWVFACKTVTKAALGIVIPCALLAVCVLVAWPESVA